jgi:hypothetical protein
MWVVSDAVLTARNSSCSGGRPSKRVAGPPGDRCDVGAELVDEAGGQVLVDRGRAAGDGEVAIPRRLTRLLQGCVDAVGHEPEAGAALHR